MKSCYGSSDTGTTISLMGNLITGVEVHKDFRGRGYARQWMTIVCDDADIERETLFLTIIPQEQDIDQERLREFYESFGFVTMSEDPYRNAMKRKPK